MKKCGGKEGGGGGEAGGFEYLCKNYSVRALVIPMAKQVIVTEKYPGVRGLISYFYY